MSKLTGLITTFVSLLFFAVVPAYADKCKDSVVDEINILDSGSSEKLQNAMSALTKSGADVRVMFLSSYHRNDAGAMHKSIAEYKASMLVKCKSWQAPDGGFKNNLILFIAVPKKQTSAVYYGRQWEAQLTGQESRYNSDMTAKFRDGDMVGGIIVGLSDITDLVSIKPSQANKPVVINHPADYSGLWKVFGWLAVITAVGLLTWLAFWIFGQIEKRRTAQRSAQTERGRCSQAVNTMDGALAILKSKVSQANITADWLGMINEALDRAESKYNEAAAAFNALNRSANNPDTPRLSVAEYSAMNNRYAGVGMLFDEAASIFEEAEEGLRRALRGDTPRPKNKTETAPAPAKPTVNADAATSARPAVRSVGGSALPQPPKERTSEIHHHHHNQTTIIRESPDVFPIPVIIREEKRDEPEWSRQDRWAEERRREPDKPVIADESQENRGQEISWGKSGSGGGGETTWGASGSGGGEEQSWSTPPAPAFEDRRSEEVSRTGY